MSSVMKIFAAAALALAGLGSQQAAATGSLAEPTAAPRGSHMRSVENALTPLAYLQFCRNNPAECRSTGRNVVVALDERLMATLRHVNSAVNRSIVPMRRSGHELVESWSVMPAAGDCNDYAVSKRHALIRRGFPRSALLLAAAVTPRGEGHLVLIVRTNQGDLVLDNLREDIRFWDMAGYRWLKRESAADPMRWERLAQPARGRVRYAAAEALMADVEVAEVASPDATAGLRLAEAQASVETLAQASVHAAGQDTGLAVGHEALSMPHWSLMRFAYGPVALASMASTIEPDMPERMSLAFAPLRGTLAPDAKAM